MKPIQMDLSQKEKAFSEFFFTFSNSKLNFEHFLKREDIHSEYISEITDSEKPD